MPDLQRREFIVQGSAVLAAIAGLYASRGQRFSDADRARKSFHGSISQRKIPIRSGSRPSLSGRIWIPS